MAELTMERSGNPEIAILLTIGSLIGTVLLLVLVTRRLAQGPKEMSA
jgi:hypothetical protein